MESFDIEAVVRDYLDSFERRDLPQCMDFYAEDARIDFAIAKYHGREAIAQWHQDRFQADMRVVRVNKVRIKDDKAVVDVTATSEVARKWRFDTVAGRVTFVFRNDKIQEAKFGLRTAIPLEIWRP